MTLLRSTKRTLFPLVLLVGVVVAAPATALSADAALKSAMLHAELNADERIASLSQDKIELLNSGGEIAILLDAETGSVLDVQEGNEPPQGSAIVDSAAPLTVVPGSHATALP